MRNRSIQVESWISASAALSTFLAVLLAVALLFAPGVALAQQAPSVASADRVDASIKRAIAFLYSRQNAQFYWDAPQRTSDSRHDVLGGQWGGLSAITVYALLASGEDPNGPKLKPAIEWLRNADIRGVYALGMRAQIWLYLPQTPQNRAAMERDATLILQLQNQNTRSAPLKDSLGTWHYVEILPEIDLSVTQYGVLGLWAAAQYGLNVPADAWRLNQDAWIRMAHIRDPSNGQWVRPNLEVLKQALQVPDMRVGWCYRGLRQDPNHPVGPSITAAGAASLFITNEYLSADAAAACNGNQANLLIDAAMNNLAAELPNIFSSNDVKYRLYTIYGIERTGVASGLKYFGDRDWFKVGSTFLVGRQGGDGSFSDGNGQIPDTCFALLFLSRGREPVMFNKAKYAIVDSGPTRAPARPRPGAPVPDPKAPAADAPKETAGKEGNWNQRPRDVAHLARYVGKQGEKSYNWQILDLAVAPLQDLIEAPVLYIAGNQKLAFSDAQLDLLKDYIERGGLILFNADCGAKPFVQSVEVLARQMYPDREFMELPENHPMMSQQLFPVSKMKGRKPRIRAITNGARLLMVLPADDLGRSWQGKDMSSRPETFQIATNIFQYAIDKEFAQVKGRSHLVLSDPQIPTNQTIKVARLSYKGEWNPEPGGWRQLASVMRNSRRIDLQVRAVDPGTASLADFKIAHLTGARDFQFTDAQRKAVKAFVDRGGVLLVDSAGGSSEFKSAVEAEFAKIFGDQAAAEIINRELPPSHVIYTAGGGAADRISYRTFAQRTVGALDRAQLRGLVVNGRLGVVYSADDLSVGIVGNQVDGITGYTPQVATALMQRMLIYANNPTPVNTGGATTKPATRP